MGDASMELHVVSHAGAEAPAGGRLRVGSSPQSIGRSPACHLCLDDPERLISRAHLAAWRDAKGVSWLKNTSSTTPAFVDGDELAPGALRQLVAGQGIVVGRFLLSVRIDHSGGSAFAAPMSTPANGSAWDPASFAQGAPITPIPAEFDVFAAPGAGSISGASSDTLAACSLAEFSGSGQGAEDLFEALPAFDARGSDLLSGSEAAEIAIASAGPAGGLLGIAPSSVEYGGGSASSGGNEIDALFALPSGAAPGIAEFESSRGRSSAAAAGPTHSGASLPVGGVSGLDDLLGAHEEVSFASVPGHEIAAPVPTRKVPDPSASGPAARGSGSRAPAAAVSAAAIASPAGLGAIEAIPPAAPPTTSIAHTDANASVLKLAFARGCGLPAECVSELDERSMEELGRLLAALVGGALQLVHARSSTKHEMRANVTIIASSGNNPLKFAPDANAALMQLLGRGLPGFMPPQQAVQDAFEDLRAHQVGLLAASRSAMYAVAERLSPERLQETAGGPRGFSGLLPSAHKARLWDLFLQSHADLLGQAREEFDSVFQNAFVHAYEGEVQRLQAGAGS